MPRDAEALAEMVVTTIKLALTPILERLAVVESHATAHGDTRDRLVAIEAKSSVVKDDGLSGKLDQLEARLTTISERLSAAELRAELKAAETVPMLAALADLTKDLGAVRERVAVVEVRAHVPGPAGADGKDGADGMGWDDLSVTHDGERTFTLKTARGERVKDAGSFTVPVDIYRGVYVEGKAYERGDGVTWGGSEWHANEPTSSRPGDGSKAWTLKVKRGRDGKDGKDAETIPVVTVGRTA